MITSLVSLQQGSLSLNLVKGVAYDNIKSHKKQGFNISLQKYLLGKTTGAC